MPGTSPRTFERFEREGSRGIEMVAALQAPPRVRTDGTRRRIEGAPARVVPLRLVPDTFGPDDLVEERLVVVHRQPRPRATRSKRGVYMRRRVIAASLGL